MHTYMTRQKEKNLIQIKWIWGRKKLLIGFNVKSEMNQLIKVEKKSKLRKVK